MKTRTLIILTVLLLSYSLEFSMVKLELSEGFNDYRTSFCLSGPSGFQKKINATISSFKNLITERKSKDYWLFTSRIDRCILVDELGERMLEENIMDQRFFSVECDESYPSYVRLENDSCDENPTLMICTPNKKKCTREIQLSYGQEILLDSCFIKYPSSFIYNLQSHYLWFKSVLDKIMNSKIACDKGAVLKGGKSPELSDEYGLIFTQADHSYFVDWRDFEINFSILPNNQIESVYIIEHNSKDDLVFCAGDVSDMEDVYDFSSLLIPNIDMVFEEQEIQDTTITYRFIDSVLKTMAFKELKKGQWYELDIKLKNDPTYYVMNFQFLSDENLDFLKSFDKR